MNALSFRKVVADGLAEIGVEACFTALPKGRPRQTDWLGTEHGFGIREYTSGRSVYIVQTRMAGKLRTVTIGSAAIITRHQAESVARRVFAHAQVGNNPAAERRRIRSAPRFDDFLDEYWQRWSPRWKPSTLKTHSRYREHYLDSAFPGLFIDDVADEHVVRWFADLNVRTGPGGANRTLSILNHLFNKAEEWGYRPANTNPCRAVRRNRDRRRDRFLSREELARLGNVLNAVRAQEDPLRRSAADAVTLLLLTGCRSSEIMGMKWSDVRGNRLTLEDSKTGPRTVWLGQDARAVIKAMPKHRDVPWLFWNARIGKQMRVISHYWSEFRNRAGLPRVRLHDLRHTFASHAAMNQETHPMIGRLLGHRSLGSTARYTHLDGRHVRQAVEQIGTAIERLMDGQKR